MDFISYCKGQVGYLHYISNAVAPVGGVDQYAVLSVVLPRKRGHIIHVLYVDQRCSYRERSGHYISCTRSDSYETRCGRDCDFGSS